MTDNFARETPYGEDQSAAFGPGSTVVPYSREAEEAVVGAVLINSEAYYDVAQFLTADDFYIHRNKWIWEAFARLHEQRIPVDLLTLSEELERAGQLAEIGGPAYLTSMIHQVPTSLNAEAYGRIVEENSIRRKMITAANQIASLAYKGDRIDHVMEEAEKAVFNVSEKRMKHDLLPIATVLNGVEAHLGEWGLGSVSETADGDAPHAATGCPFQAWSVAEVFRARRIGQSML